MTKIHSKIELQNNLQFLGLQEFWPDSCEAPHVNLYGAIEILKEEARAIPFLKLFEGKNGAFVDYVSNL